MGLGSLSDRVHVCSFNGYSNSGADIAQVCFFIIIFLQGHYILLLELEMVVASCNIPMHFANLGSV